MLTFVFCLLVKRDDIGDLAQEVDLGSDGERPDIQEARGGEGRRDGGRERDGFRNSREGDDLRSELSDLSQLSEERQLPNIGNRRNSPTLDSALGRLRSLLRTTELDVDDREEEEEKEEEKEKKQEEKKEQEEEPGRRSSTDTDRRYIVKDNLTMLRRIVSRPILFNKKMTSSATTKQL